jgi:hypothetical protein
MDWDDGIEDKGPGRTVGHPTSPTPSNSTLDKLINTMLAGLFRHEWVQNERDPPRTVIIEKSD